MRAPIFNILSLVLPVVAGAWGYTLARSAKGATNMGEALGPWFALAFVLTAAALAGELAAVISLVRGERLGWLSWIGVAGNGVLLLPVIYFVATADWS
jgi:hypothetical protein